MTCTVDSLLLSETVPHTIWCNLQIIYLRAGSRLLAAFGFSGSNPNPAEF